MKTSVSLVKLLWPSHLDLYVKKLEGFVLLCLAMGEEGTKREKH